jgi:sulfite exporter TauE/SafE
LIFFLGKFTLERLLGSFSKYVLIIGGGFIILVGILTALGKNLEIKPMPFLYKNILGHDKKSVVLLGLVVGLLPCAPLLGVLYYAGLISRSWLESLWYSFSFGLGTFVSPLILLCILAGIIPQWLENKKYYYVFRFICGLVIIFLGVQLLMRGL